MEIRGVQNILASPRRWAGGVAVMMVLVSCVAIGIAPVFAKLAFDGGSNAFSVITARNVMMTIMLGVTLVCLGRSLRLQRRALVRSLAMGPVYIALAFGYLGAVAYIPVNLTILIYFLHPLLVGLIMRLIGQEVVSLPRIGALCIAITGLGIMIGAKWAHLNAIGIGLAFMSAIACTIMIVGNSITMKSADSVVTTFWMVLSATIILAASHIVYGRMVWPDDRSGWIGFFGVGIAYTVGLTLFFMGVSLLGAARAAMLSNVEPVLGVLFAMLILGEHISGLQEIGMVLVFISIGLMEIAR